MRWRCHKEVSDRKRGIVRARAGRRPWRGRWCTDDAYIRCIEEQAKTCNYPIMRHFLELTEAYKMHVKQLEMLESEEQQG